jgi:hypothetical protein
MDFTAPLELHGKTATGIEVPEKVIVGLNAGKRVPVKVTINGFTFATTVAPYNGKYLIPVSADIRANANVSAGDSLTVTIEVDATERKIAVPDDLTAAFKKDAAAKKFFATLSLSNQRGYVDWIEQAKKPETRTARVEKAIELLAEGRKTRS